MNKSYYRGQPNSFSVSVDMAGNSFFALLQKFLFLLFIFFSLVIFLASKNNIVFDNVVRKVSVGLTTPISKIIEIPIATFSYISHKIKEVSFAVKRNRQLERDNLFFKNISSVYENIRDENENLKNILNYVNDSFPYKFRTAKILYKNSGSLTEKMVINAGSEDGVKEGDAILSENLNIIGRVINVNKNKSDVLLLSDFNSKIPVLTDRNRVKGILIGKNSNKLSFEYFDKGSNIQLGDMIYTTGDGNVIPSGLYVGSIISVDENTAEVEMDKSIKRVNTVLIIIRNEEENEWNKS